MASKFQSLETCRFGASLAVLFWHYQHFLIHGLASDELIKALDRSQLPLYYAFSLFYERGYFAVQIFWMISGFIFFWKYADDIYTNKISLRKFFVLRFSRLYPLHVLSLLVVGGLQATYYFANGTTFIYGQNDLPHLVLHTLMASNWLQGQPFTFNAPIWSVSAEVIIYFLFFALVSQIRPTLIFACVCAGLSWLLLKSGLFEIGSPMLNCAKFFFLGAAMQLLYIRLQGRNVIVGFVISLFVLTLFSGLIWADIIGWSEKAIAVIAATFIFACVTGENIFASIPFGKVASLGNLTYSTYLLHFPLQIAFVLVVDAAGIAREIFIRPEVLFIYLAATLLLGYVTYHRVEVSSQAIIRFKMIRSSKAIVEGAGGKGIIG